jgi:hypothetical protein
MVTTATRSGMNFASADVLLMVTLSFHKSSAGARADYGTGVFQGKAGSDRSLLLDKYTLRDAHSESCIADS